MSTIAPTRPTTPQIPAPRTPHPVPLPPAAAMCGACNGQGGSFITSDGQSPGKTIDRWVPCKPCKGTGQK